MRISSSKPIYATKSSKRVDKTHTANEIVSVERSYTIQHLNKSRTMIEMSEPELYPIPKEEKEKFINDALYKDENRLLQVILNTINQTTVGKEFYPYLKAFSESKKIYFADTACELGAYAIFGIISMEKNDINIIVAKDNCIPFLASSLIHEISHYLDFRELFTTDKKYYTRLDSEIKAFANSHRFLIEGDYTNDFWYQFLSEKDKKLHQSCYDYTYQNSLYLKNSLSDMLLERGYKNLSDGFKL